MTNEVFGSLVHHNGALLPQGYTSEMGYLPASDTSVVVLTNRPLGAGNEKPFAGALLRKATGAPERPPVEPSVVSRLGDSLFFLAQMFLAPWLLWLLYRDAWRPKTIDRQTYWVNYHASALIFGVLLCYYPTDPLHPSLWLWAVLVLAGAWRSRWWALPNWQRGQGVKAYLNLGLRCLGLLVLIFFLTEPLLGAFAVVCVFEWLMRLVPDRAPALSARG